MKILYFILFPVVVYFTSVIMIKYSFLLSQSGDSHQKFAEKKNIPLIGGIFVLINYLVLFHTNFNLFNYFLIIIFILGLFSDTKFIRSPIIRFLLQAIIILLLVIFNDLSINYTRIIFLDYLLDNNFFNIFFVSFCIIILINGSNFIDGLNTLLIGYYLIVSIILYKLNLVDILEFNSFYFLLWILSLTFLYFFNFFKKIFMGDNGAYVLGLIIGFILIKLYEVYNAISPFFIILLLWYPCFELLFSIIRKFKFKKSPLEPDTQHFHQLLYYYLVKSKISKNNINSISSNLINLYNLIILLLASEHIYNSQFQIFLLLINIFVYSYLYFKLFFLKFNKK